MEDVLIHVMPREFYGKPAGALVAPAPLVIPVPVPVAAPTLKPIPLSGASIPPLTKGGRQTASGQGGVSRATLVLAALGLLLVASLIVGGFFLLKSVTPVAPVDTTPTPSDTVSGTTPTPSVPSEPVPGTDTDSDGLTNVEELLYGTDFRAPDTDHDTFLDGNEVFHRYDPNGLAPSTLLDTGAVRVFSSESLDFTLYYPTSWTPRIEQDAARVVFRAPSGTMFLVSWQDKDQLLTLEDWVAALPTPPQKTEATYTKEGLYALTADDARTVYVDGGATVYTFTYDLADTLTIDFLQTFKMMVNSFVLHL